MKHKQIDAKQNDCLLALGRRCESRPSSGANPQSFARKALRCTNHLHLGTHTGGPFAPSRNRPHASGTKFPSVATKNASSTMLQPHMHCCAEKENDRMHDSVLVDSRLCTCVARNSHDRWQLGAGSICPAPPDPEPRARSLQFRKTHCSCQSGKTFEERESASVLVS